MVRRTLAACGAFAALAVTLGLTSVPAQAAPLVPVAEADGVVVPGEYIVTTRPGAVTVAADAGVAVLHRYEHALHGFAARLDDRQLRALRRDKDVLAIEPNQVVHALTTQTPTPNWGLDRIDQRALPLNNQYTFTSTGTGVTAYVIDTGIQPTHPEFAGRAVIGYDATGGNGIDCNGHGTHIAGIIGSATYGVAKRVRLSAVRVLNCTGSGTIAQVIAGVNWVQANSPGPAVANMSLGGGSSAAMNTAVNNLAASGVFVAVSGGSSGSDACNFSPSGASGAFAVSATDRNDNAASFNNFGRCIKMCAPGVLITSTWLNGGSATLSGTSMANPHVAGVAAMYKQVAGDQSSPTVAAWLLRTATPIPPTSCSGLLLYTGGL
ncbi:MAG TPA: S8 family peptidase [Pseudonocardiaceae bacterium]